MTFPYLKHPGLGILRYNNTYDWYEGQINFRQSQLSIRITTDNEGTIESILDKVDRVVIQLDVYAENAKDYAVEKLLELKNETWLDEDEELLTSEQFKNRMVLESIVFSSEGDVEFYHNDGDLFFGHCILITMDSSDHFIDADIPG